MSGEKTFVKFIYSEKPKKKFVKNSQLLRQENMTTNDQPAQCKVFTIKLVPKGQKISKCLFGVFNSSKKRTKASRPEVS